MKKNEQDLLHFLNAQDTWETSFAIAALLNVSVRSVKSYIGEINSQYPNLISSSPKGFLIKDKIRVANILSQKDSSLVPQTSEDRVKYILKKLLLEEDSYAIDQLSDEMFVSPATLSNEIPKVKNKLVDFGLAFKTKNGLAEIDGSEEDKKRLVSKLIYDDTKDSFLSIKAMQRYLPNFDLTLIKEIVSLALRSNNYFMDDFSLLNLVLNITITLERKRIRKTITDEGPIDWQSLANPHIQTIVNKMTTDIEQHFQVSFLPSEIYPFAILITTRAISDSINDITPEHLQEFVGADVINLVSLMQKKVKETFNISITNPDFTVQFSLHIKNLLARLTHNVELRNPQKSEIKNSYPFIYDVSVFLANVLTQETGYPLSEDEISYFALYLGVLIDERKAIKSEVKTVLVIPQYFLRPTGLSQVLSSTFDGTLYIMGIVSSFDELETYSDYDLIITTLAVNVVTQKSCVRVSNHLNPKDIRLITQKIESIIKNRLKTRVESKLRLMFREELFFVGDNMKNQDDVIEKLSNTLESYGYVNSSFKEKVFEREAVSSSAYLHIAMPHPFEMCALNSSIAVSLHPTGLPWNDSKVFIVFLLAINIRDSLFFKDIFDFITEVISEEANLKNILEQKSFDQFISTLVSYAK